MPVAEQVLSRFPRHLDLDGRGKVVGELTTSLATALEAQISQVGKVRRAHRVGEVEQVVDLVRLANLDGLTESFLGPLGRRARLLADPATDVDGLVAQLGFGHDPDEVLVTWPGEADDADARERFDAVVRDAVRYDGVLGVGREALVDVAELILDRSGTVAGLLGATAAYLGLELVGAIGRDVTGYWHLAHARDRFAIELPAAPGDGPGASRHAGTHLLALEENPPHLADSGPIPRRHADLFTVSRLGFEQVPVDGDRGRLGRSHDAPDGRQRRRRRGRGDDRRRARRGRAPLRARRPDRARRRERGAALLPLPRRRLRGRRPPQRLRLRRRDRRGRVRRPRRPLRGDGPDRATASTRAPACRTATACSRRCSSRARGSRFAAFVGVGTFARERGRRRVDLAAPGADRRLLRRVRLPARPDRRARRSRSASSGTSARPTPCASGCRPRSRRSTRDGEPSIRELIRDPARPPPRGGRPRLRRVHRPALDPRHRDRARPRLRRRARRRRRRHRGVDRRHQPTHRPAGRVDLTMRSVTPWHL